MATFYVTDALGNVVTFETDRVEPRVNLVLSVDQSIPNSVWTSISFNSEVYDSSALHDLVTNPSRVTIPANEGGQYLVLGHVPWVALATGTRQARILKNGTAVYNLHKIDGSATVQSSNRVDELLLLAAGDYVELQAWQNSGASLGVKGQSTGSQASFAVVRMAGSPV